LQIANALLRKNYANPFGNKNADNRVGVVACSNDINFDIPSTKDEYDEIIFTRSGKKKG